MKKILVFVIVLSSFYFFTTKAMARTYDDLKSVCEHLSKVATVAMQNRQRNQPIVEVTKFTNNNYLKNLVPIFQ